MRRNRNVLLDDSGKYLLCDHPFEKSTSRISGTFILMLTFKRYKMKDFLTKYQEEEFNRSLRSEVALSFLITFVLKKFIKDTFYSQ